MEKWSKLLFVSGLRWSPLLICIFTLLTLLTFILKGYPEYKPHTPTQKQHPGGLAGLELVRTGLFNIDAEYEHAMSYEFQEQGRPVTDELSPEQATGTTESNLSHVNGSICFDYRKVQLAKQPQIVIRPPAIPSKSNARKSLMVEEVYQVEKFVFFVGYPRSGHSIVGSIMDAHPNMVIAHEYNLFREWEKSSRMHAQRLHLYNALFRNSVESAASGWRSEVKAEKGYTLGLGYKWQGNFTQLKVIGDKSGAVTTQIFDASPERFLAALKELSRTVRVPLRVIHVIRNPYDMISTRLLYADAGKKRKSKLPATEDLKHCDLHGLSYQINRTFHLVNSVHRLLEKTNLTFLNIHHSDLVADPRVTVSTLCKFLDLPCPPDYLDACARKVYAKSSRTRELVTWPESMIEEVQLLSKPYSFLSRYSFEGS